MVEFSKEKGEALSAAITGFANGDAITAMQEAHASTKCIGSDNVLYTQCAAKAHALANKYNDVVLKALRDFTSVVEDYTNLSVKIDKAASGVSTDVKASDVGQVETGTFDAASRL